MSLFLNIFITLTLSSQQRHYPSYIIIPTEQIRKSELGDIKLHDQGYKSVSGLIKNGIRICYQYLLKFLLAGQSPLISHYKL